MKKLFALLLTMLIILVPVQTAFGEEPAGGAGEETTGSEFEQVLLKKGTLIIKEFIDCGEVDDMSFQAATLTDVETGSEYKAVRIEAEYWHSKYDSGTSIGILDYDEIDGAITTLEYIQEHLTELKDYSEVVFTAESGTQVGAYHSSSSDRVLIKLDRNDTEYFGTEDINAIISKLQETKEQLDK